MTSFIIRPMGDDDLNFVRATWMRELGPTRLGAWLGDTLGDYAVIRDRCIEQGEVTIASLESEPTAVCGWACTEGDDVLHFVYVKERWRGNGLMRMLLSKQLESEHVTYTHRSKKCQDLPIPATWLYRPLRAMRALPLRGRLSG